MAKANPITALKQDHQQIKALFEELAGTSERGPKKRTELFAKLEREIKAHSRLEEELFYPAFRDAAQKKKEDLRLYNDAVEEHHVVDLVMPEVKRADPSTPVFAARAKVLREIVERHIEQEERHLFPRVRELFGREALEELGARMEARKAELRAHHEELFGTSADLAEAPQARRTNAAQAEPGGAE